MSGMKHLTEFTYHTNMSCIAESMCGRQTNNGETADQGRSLRPPGAMSPDRLGAAARGGHERQHGVCQGR